MGASQFPTPMTQLECILINILDFSVISSAPYIQDNCANPQQPLTTTVSGDVALALAMAMDDLSNGLNSSLVSELSVSLTSGHSST